MGCQPNNLDADLIRRSFKIENNRCIHAKKTKLMMSSHMQESLELQKNYKS